MYLILNVLSVHKEHGESAVATALAVSEGSWTRKQNDHAGLQKATAGAGDTLFLRPVGSGRFCSAVFPSHVPHGNTPKNGNSQGTQAFLFFFAPVRLERVLGPPKALSLFAFASFPLTPSRPTITSASGFHLTFLLQTSRL